MRGSDNIAEQGFMYWAQGAASSRQAVTGKKHAPAVPSDATTVKATGSATLVPVDGDHGEVFIYLTPKGLPPHARCMEVPWPEE